MPRPLISIGELIDTSWDHYRRHFVDLLSISGWLLLKSIVDIVALSLYPTVTKLATQATLTVPEQAGVILFIISNAVLAPIIGIWVFVGLVRLSRAQLLGRSDVRAAMLDAKKYFFPTLWISILIFLVLLAALAIGFGPTLILLGLGTLMKNGMLMILANILLIFGVFAAFILSFRWTLHYAMAPYALLTENIRGRAAMMKSRKLAEGRFWAVLARYALPKVVFVLFGLVAMGILSYITTLAVSAAAGLNVDVQLRLITITSSIFPIVIAAIVNPLLVIADVLLYRSLAES